MKELKILGVVVALTLITYIGVEPFAHSQMHPHVEAPDYSFKDLGDVRQGKTGNVANGKSLIVEQFQCQSCHTLTVDGAQIGNSMDLGVMTPDLTSAGTIYEANYLAAFIADPAKAGDVAHKFEGNKTHPMTKLDMNYDGTFGDDDAQAVADIVAFLKSIAPSSLTDKEVFIDACGRCHSMKYAGLTATTVEESVAKYMGTVPPDLSQYIKSRSKNYLHEFINLPQKHLEGTAMPRTGLTESAEEQVVTFMEDIGDSKKAERESLGINVLLYLAVLAVFAWLWKIKIWREVH